MLGTVVVVGIMLGEIVAVVDVDQLNSGLGEGEPLLEVDPVELIDGAEEALGREEALSDVLSLEDTELLADTIAVSVGHPDVLAETLCEADEVELGEAVMLAVAVDDQLNSGLAETETLDEADIDTVGVEDHVCVVVPVGVIAGDEDVETLAVVEPLDVVETLGKEVVEWLEDDELLPELDSEGEDVGVASAVRETLGDVETDTDPEIVVVAVVDRVFDVVGVPDLVALEEALRELRAEVVPLTLTDREPLGDADTDVVFVVVAESELAAEGDTVVDDERLLVIDRVPVVLTVPVRDTDVLPEEEPLEEASGD